jgi:hypothetical protein
MVVFVSPSTLTLTAPVCPSDGLQISRGKSHYHKKRKCTADSAAGPLIKRRRQQQQQQQQTADTASRAKCQRYDKYEDRTTTVAGRAGSYLARQSPLNAEYGVRPSQPAPALPWRCPVGAAAVTERCCTSEYPQHPLPVRIETLSTQQLGADSTLRPSAVQ